MFLPSNPFNLRKFEFAGLREIWHNDYHSICNQLRDHIQHSPDGFIHTSNGTHIQIRSKYARDSSGNYHPIYSNMYGRYVSTRITHSISRSSSCMLLEKSAACTKHAQTQKDIILFRI